MTPEELAAKLESTIIAANETLGAGIIKVQDSLYPQIVKVLKDLELDDQGLILQNAGNRALISKALNVLDQKVASSQYQALVERYLETIPKIDALNISYFEAISSAFKPNRQFLASLQKDTVKQIEDLLFNSGFESQIIVPLRTILNQNINSGGQFVEMLEQVKTYIKGTPSIDGKLLRYAKQITSDALFNYSRAYHLSLSNDLGLTWYCYSGGLTDKSRPFCIDHADHYYPKTEVESWAAEDWTGKRPDTTETTIFIYVGGFFCRHSLVPVSESVVPQEDIQSAKERGFVS